MTDEREENLSLAAMVQKLRDGETLTPAEHRRLRSALEARAVELGKVIGRAGGMDAKAAKREAARLAAEVKRLGAESGQSGDST